MGLEELDWTDPSNRQDLHMLRQVNSTTLGDSQQLHHTPAKNIMQELSLAYINSSQKEICKYMSATSDLR